MIEESISFANLLIDEDVADIKENGTLYVQSENLTIQGGNINATRLYWWGWHRYNSNTNTKRIIREFKKQVTYSNHWVTEILFGSLATAPAGFAIAAIPKMLGGSLNSFANALESKNKGYGTIIAVNWVVVGSNIKSQTKNTK